MTRHERPRKNAMRSRSATHSQADKPSAEEKERRRLRNGIDRLD
jgi:hypothetical protein